MWTRLTNPRWHWFLLACLTLLLALPGLSSLPVIDRDEARFAQASQQMAETNDFLNIKFQNEARNKKPAMAYWAQTAMIKVFSGEGDQQIWVHRLPSVLAALISILALYWGGAKMVGRDAALIAAALLAVSTNFVFEAHIAKTDALLCASTTIMLVCLGRLRIETGKREVWGFWIALGLSILIKGPIGLLLAVSCLASLWFWEKDLSWSRPLLNIGAILAFSLIWIPWGITMYVATNGAFFVESLGGDLGGKITSGQEGHGFPPGGHSLAIWATLWPSCLFLLPGLACAVLTVRSRRNNTITRSMRLILCWVVPFWILIELMPTKLPHYGLPVFPALCLTMGTGVLAMQKIVGFDRSRFFGGLIFLLTTIGMLAIPIVTHNQFGDPDKTFGVYVICGLCGLTAIIAWHALWDSRIWRALGATLICSVIYSIGAYSYILPSLTDFKTSERLRAEIDRFAPDFESGKVHSPHYSEPSLVFHLGKDINISNTPIDLSDGRLGIVNLRRASTEKEADILNQQAKRRGKCLDSSKNIEGFNYSNGTPLSLVILREGPC